jgi:hypothetical protein
MPGGFKLPAGVRHRLWVDTDSVGRASFDRGSTWGWRPSRKGAVPGLREQPRLAYSKGCA